MIHQLAGCQKQQPSANGCLFFHRRWLAWGAAASRILAAGVCTRRGYMVRNRSALMLAAGQLISAVQKVFIDDMGTEASAESEAVMDRAHLLLQAAKRSETLTEVLGQNSISQFLGASWVAQHPAVHSGIALLEAANLAHSP